MKNTLKFFLLLALWISLLPTNAEEPSCIKQFGDNLRENPCDCFYKSKEWYLSKKQNIIDNFLQKIEGQTSRTKKDIYPKVTKLIFNAYSSINKKEISISEEAKSSFFAAWSYLTCEIYNEYAKDPEFYSSELWVLFKWQALNLLPTDSIPEDLELYDFDFIKYDTSLIRLYTKNDFPWVADYLIHDLESGKKIHLKNNFSIRQIERWLSWFYLLESWENAFTRVTLIKHNWEIISLLNWWSDNGKNTTIINNFELLENKKINVSYNNNQYSKVIDISTLVD